MSHERSPRCVCSMTKGMLAVRLTVIRPVGYGDWACPAMQGVADRHEVADARPLATDPLW